MVREFIEVSGNTTLDALIAQLSAIREAIPGDAGEEQVCVRGDYDFGHHILVTYLRPETPEEVESGIRAMRFASAWSKCPQSVCG